MRAALLLAAVPLAILANAWRVGLAVVAGLRSPKLAEEPYHLLLGWLIFVLCLGGMRVVQWVINKVYARARS
jgi:exosortase/archaeosortase family protein